jgi:hypothetical protein
MSQLLKDQLPFLQFLNSQYSTAKQKEYVLNNLSGAQIDALTEIVYNLLAGNIPVAPTQRTQLRRYKKSLRLLGDSHLTQRLRKAEAKVAPVTAIIKLTLPIITQLATTGTI